MHVNKYIGGIEMKKRHTLYTVLSFAAVVVPVALDLAMNYLRLYYGMYFKVPVLVFIIVILSPIITSILLFAKIILQKDIPVRFSRLINVAATVVFLVGAAIFYRYPSILSSIATYPALALIFCLQLCCLVYDILGKRKSSD